MNGHGFYDGFGSQGLSLLDTLTVSCTGGMTGSTASNWCPGFGSYYKTGSPLELQQLSLSNETDSSCSACGIPPADSGNLRVWLPFAVTNHMTVLELYYHDAGLAYDPNYCASFFGGVCTGGYTTRDFLTPSLQRTFMNDVGQGMNCPGGGSGAGNASTGNCAYAIALDAAHGYHPRP